eukprot:9461857-Prorocentrum_lima.AAC.1
MVCMMSAGEDEEACLVHQLADGRELAIQGRQQREEHLRHLASDQMTAQAPQPTVVDRHACVRAR